MLERGRVLGDEVRGEAFAGFDAAERESLIDMLLRVRGNLSERRGDEERAPVGQRAKMLETAP